MKNKKLFIVSLIIFSLTFNSIGFFVNADSQTQTWENEYGKLEVYPMISRNLIRQKQFYNFTWYYPDNIIDIAFRFNESLDYGKVYYFNGSHYLPVSCNHVEFSNKHYYIFKDVHVFENEVIHGYWEYDTPINSSGKWDLFVKLSSDSWQYAFSNNRYIHLDPWWDSDWMYSKKITLNSSQVSSDLSNFPVCINITDSDLKDNAQPDGDDITFVDATNTTQFNHEIEEYDNTNGKLVAWVNVTSLSSTSDTIIYMYYGNDAASNQENPTNTWDSQYVAVYHFENANDVLNNINGINNGVSFGSSSNIGYQGTFIASENDYIRFDNDFGVDNNDFTLEMYLSDSGNSDADAHLWNFVGESKAALRLNDFWRRTSGTPYTTSLSIDTSYSYYAVSYDLDGNCITYKDGSQIDSDSNTGNIDDRSDWNAFGRNPDNEICYFDGDMSEVRCSNVVRDSNWLVTSYNTVNNATDGGFFSLDIQKEAVVKECFISNLTPVNKSIDVSRFIDNITFDINCTCGVFNYTVEFLNLSKTENGVSNGSFYLNISNVLPLNSSTNHTIYVNVTGCNISNNSFFWFITELGCECTDELNFIYDRLNYIINNMYKGSERMNIYVNIMPIILYMLVVIFLLVLAEWKEDTGYYTLTGMLSLPLSFYYFTNNLGIGYYKDFAFFIGFAFLGISIYSITLGYLNYRSRRNKNFEN